MDDIFDLLITPFNDIVTKGQIAVENAGDDGPMLKAAQSLVTEGERALNKIEPLYRMLLDKHGSKFQDFLKENDAISNLHSELNDLLWEFDDYIELDDFEPEKFAELESVSRSAAPKIYDILTGMKLEVPTDHDTRMKLEVPTDHDYRLRLLPTLALPHTRSLLKSPTESVETNQSSVFDHSRTDGINTPFPDHHGSSISTADSNPILSTAELNPLLIKVPSIKNYQGAVKPEKSIRVPEVDYFPIPVETEVQTPQHPPNPPNPFAVDCKLSPQSSFYVHKGFCDGVKEIINGGPGVRKTVKAGFASRAVIAKCITCHFELDFKELDLDINKSEHGNFIKNGIGYRLRFLQKSHLPTRRSDDIMYGCIFCVHQGQTLHASDATVFVSQKALFAHLARHPRPLPAVPGFTLIEQDEIPDRYKNNYDLHFKSPVETHPVLEKSDDICKMPAGISKEAARRMYGQRLLYDRTPALELVQGARIVGLSWPAKYLGEWCFGWHDGVYASLPMNILRLDPPPSSDIKTDGTSLVMATARWNFNVRDKFNHNWLKFEKDEVITNITWPYQEFWCWSGTNAKGKSGIFPQAFIDISTLKEFGGPGSDQADRASVLNNERRRNKSFSVPLRFPFRKKSRAEIPASIPRSASSRELPSLLTPIPGAYTRDDPSAWDKTQAEALLPILDQQKTKDYKIEAPPATNDLDHHQSLGEATNMESINEELLLDMKLEEVHQFGKCWTCSPIDSISTDKVPITISDVPVVIPVESRYPLRAPVTPPPDPHPKFIDPTRQITDNVISEIFRVYEDALGFYLLINGQLQIIIPDDFDYQYALSHRPREFGGLEVSYIMESMTPTAGITSQASAQVPQISTNASIPTQLAPGVNSTAGQSPTAHIDAMLKLTIGSAIQASVKGTKLKDRFEGRVGLMTRMGDRTFVTIPTHVVTAALTEAKSASFPGDSWINDVQIVSSNGNKELGPISETFDPAAGHFPLGFIHDVSLVDVSNAPVELVSNIKTSVPTEWLSNSGWQEIRYRTTRLHLLKHVSIVPSRQANIKSIGLLECQCQAVGQGIFRMRQPPRTTRFSLRRPSTGLDVRQDSEVWTGLVARSLLFRIHPDFRPDGAQSGTALCTMEELEDGTSCAKVAGFTAFAQDVSVVQNFDLEGPRLYSRLEQGRVAFYGAFQVPEVLREKHHIM